jgi:predicted LPLAT superfamily acyltransferase
VLPPRCGDDGDANQSFEKELAVRRTFEPFADRLGVPRPERERALQRYANLFASQLEQHCPGGTVPVV